LEFPREGPALKEWVSILRKAVCWLALSACLQAQPSAWRAHRQVIELRNLAENPLVPGKSSLLWLAAGHGVVRGFELCFLTGLVLMLVAALRRARRLREKSLDLERLVDERTRELELTREQLRIQLAHDVLTGMLNRAGILRELTTEMDRTRREGGTLLVTLADLDQFKRVNDAYGYQAGDEALRWFAAAVGTAIRVYDHAGRYGGAEFLLVLTEIQSGSAAERLGSLHASISNLQIYTREAEFGITCSMGATVFDSSVRDESAEALLAAADQALYAAKTTGRNRAVLHRGDSPGAVYRSNGPAVSALNPLLRLTPAPLRSSSLRSPD
jgi:diguanylate cyclase (GGDEF)-like protein